MVGVSSRGLAVGEIGLVDIYHLVICRWASRRANTGLFLCIWQIEKRKEKKEKKRDRYEDKGTGISSIYLSIYLPHCSGSTYLLPFPGGLGQCWGNPVCVS